MTWYEAIIAAGALAGALAAVFKLLKPIVTAAEETITIVRKMQEHDEDQYLSILRLTIMSPDMPISERIIAGKKYIEKGGNGDVKLYYEKLISEHIK